MLELSVSLLTAGLAATLVPAIRRSTPRLIEVMLWIGLVGAGVLTISEHTNPRASELTVSVVWGAGQLIHTEASLLLAGVRGWVLIHRFDIARVVVIVAGADALAIAFMEAVRSARSFRGARLHDWYVLPRTPIPDAVGDPLAGLNRRLAGATRTALRSAGRRLVTTPVAERLAVLAAHELRPGHLRLALIKIGLGIEPSRPVEQPAPAAIRPPLTVSGPRSRRGPGPKQDQPARHRLPAPIDLKPRAAAGATRKASRPTREMKNGAAQQRRHRLAS